VSAPFSLSLNSFRRQASPDSAAIVRLMFYCKRLLLRSRRSTVYSLDLQKRIPYPDLHPSIFGLGRGIVMVLLSCGFLQAW
ncbi:hypothetical protein L195_g059123, partial [Trifolium pratense]